MRILHVGKYFWPFQGGLENYLRDLIVALANRGIRSTALVHAHDRTCRTSSESIRLEGHDIPVIRVGTWLKILFAPISPAFPWQMRRLVRSTRPDVLHLHLPNPSAFWALTLPSARRIPWVVHWHADVITARQGWAMKLAYALYRPLERSVLKRAAAIVATSAPYRDSSQPLQPWLGKCRVVPLGMAAGRLGGGASTDAPGDRKTQPLRVLFVGRLTYYKGLRYLVEAASKFEGMHLELVGDGDQKTELTQLVASLDLESRVTLHGSITDDKLAELLEDCDCLCLPSIERTEAFGMVLLEAMRFGKATVVSDVPGSGMGWLVEHEVTGLKVDPANSGQLADAFRCLADDRELCRRMGDRGREKFDRLLEINQTAGGIMDIYSEVLQHKEHAAHKDRAT